MKKKAISIKRFLIIGAHPDDAEIVFGGCAVKLTKQGHKVKFISCCNGDAGHHSEKSKPLAARRKQEALKSASLAKLDGYEILNNHDCELVPSIANRRKIVEIIRTYKPDVVISHRPCDYHADHRATAQLVQDSSYLIMVPLFCPEIKVPKNNPVYLFSHDTFKKPYPFSPDVVVGIDDVMAEKLDMLDCHKSQFYEWLAYIEGELSEIPVTREGRLKWIKEKWLTRNKNQAILYKDLLKSRYAKKATDIKYAESFELSEYGRQPEKNELNELFPF